MAKVSREQHGVALNWVVPFKIQQAKEIQSLKPSLQGRWNKNESVLWEWWAILRNWGFMKFWRDDMCRDGLGSTTRETKDRAVHAAKYAPLDGTILEHNLATNVSSSVTNSQLKRNASLTRSALGLNVPLHKQIVLHVGLLFLLVIDPHPMLSSSNKQHNRWGI